MKFLEKILISRKFFILALLSLFFVVPINQAKAQSSSQPENYTYESKNNLNNDCQCSSS